MTTRFYGFAVEGPRNEWQLVKEIAREILLERASLPDDYLIPYSRLTAEVVTRLSQQAASVGAVATRELVEKTREILTPESNALAEMLREISTESASCVPDQGMLTVIVVHKTGDQRPGSGFFACARELGRLPANASEAQEDEFWIRELDLVQRSHTSRQ